MIRRRTLSLGFPSRCSEAYLISSYGVKAEALQALTEALDRAEVCKPDGFKRYWVVRFWIVQKAKKPSESEYIGAVLQHSVLGYARSVHARLQKTRLFFTRPSVSFAALPGGHADRRSQPCKRRRHRRNEAVRLRHLNERFNTMGN